MRDSRGSADGNTRKTIEKATAERCESIESSDIVLKKQLKAQDGSVRRNWQLVDESFTENCSP